MTTIKLLTIDGNPKTAKGAKLGVDTAILHLAPADLSGWNVCPQASEGCKAACLNTAGRGGIFKPGETTNAIQRARLARTQFYFQARPEFMAQLVRELRAFGRRARRNGLKPAVRLNGTSDIAWERVALNVDGLDYANVMEYFPEFTFYDYTKVTKRAAKALLEDTWPRNYTLTFSLTEANDSDAELILKAGGTVAAVFFTMPETFLGHRVIDGDETDVRFLDPQGVVVGLKAKGKARKDASGFVR